MADCVIPRDTIPLDSVQRAISADPKSRVECILNDAGILSLGRLAGIKAIMMAVNGQLTPDDSRLLMSLCTSSGFPPWWGNLQRFMAIERKRLTDLVTLKWVSVLSHLLHRLCLDGEKEHAQLWLAANADRSDTQAYAVRVFLRPHSVLRGEPSAHLTLRIMGVYRYKRFRWTSPGLSPAELYLLLNMALERWLRFQISCRKKRRVDM